MTAQLPTQSFDINIVVPINLMACAVLMAFPNLPASEPVALGVKRILVGPALVRWMVPPPLSRLNGELGRGSGPPQALLPSVSRPGFPPTEEKTLRRLPWTCACDIENG